MDQVEATCLACGSPHVIPIAHDTLDPELAELEREDQEILAGCPVGEDDPDWRCRACDYEWIDPTITHPV
jgi:hypothetical protein